MTIYTTAQWEALIMPAFKKHEPILGCLQYTDVIDFKSNYFPNVSKMMRANVYDTDGERVFWSKIMLLKVDKKDPTTFLFKYNYGESSFKKLKMNARKAKKNKALHERDAKKIQSNAFYIT